MSSNVHPVLMHASRAGLFVVEVVETLCELIFVLLESVMTLVVQLIEGAGKSSRERARLAAINRRQREMDRRDEMRRREEFTWRARESAKAMRDYGPKSKSSGGGFFFSLVLWGLIAYAVFGVIVPHITA